MPLIAADGATSKHGQRFDRYGDVAQNDGLQGHGERHCALLDVLVAVLRSEWGGAVEKEPAAYRDYSDHRPDLTVTGVGSGGALLAGDLKLFCPIDSDAAAQLRAAYVAFGGTQPAARLKVHGLAERAGVGSWNWRTGDGHVAAVAGDYKRAEALGVDVRCLLIETFGGLSPAVCEILRQIAEQRQNRLRSDEYDYATWSTRSWRAFAVQKLAVATQRSAAMEIARAMGLTTAYDTRGGLGGGPECAVM